METKVPTGTPELDVLAIVMQTGFNYLDVRWILEDMIQAGKKHSDSKEIQELDMPIQIADGELICMSGRSHSKDSAFLDAKFKTRFTADMKVFQEFYQKKRRYQTPWVVPIIRLEDKKVLDDHLADEQIERGAYFAAMRMFAALTQQPITIENHGMYTELQDSKRSVSKEKQAIIDELISGNLSKASKKYLTDQDWKAFYDLMPSRKESLARITSFDGNEEDLDRNVLLYSDNLRRTFIQKADLLKRHVTEKRVLSLEEAVDECIEHNYTFTGSWLAFFAVLLNDFMFPGCMDNEKTIIFQAESSDKMPVAAEVKDFNLLFVIQRADGAYRGYVEDETGDSVSLLGAKKLYQNFLMLGRYFTDSGFAQAHPAVKALQLSQLPRKPIGKTHKTEPTLPTDLRKHVAAFLAGKPAGQRACNWCLKPNPARYCTGCEAAFYCDWSCQFNDWNRGGHMLACV
jgi:hypothetical protein